MNAEVRRFIEGAPEDRRGTVSALRRLVLGAAPQSTESVVWRSPSYHLPELGGRVRGAVCLITPRPTYVELGFIHGVLLPDPAHVLTGDGLSKRVVRLTRAPDLAQRRTLDRLIRAAVAIRPTLPDG